MNRREWQKLLTIDPSAITNTKFWIQMHRFKKEKEKSEQNKNQRPILSD